MRRRWEHARDIIRDTTRRHQGQVKGSDNGPEEGMGDRASSLVTVRGPAGASDGQLKVSRRGRGSGRGWPPLCLFGGAQRRWLIVCIHRALHPEALAGRPSEPSWAPLGTHQGHTGDMDGDMDADMNGALHGGMLSRRVLGGSSAPARHVPMSPAACAEVEGSSCSPLSI